MINKMMRPWLKIALATIAIAEDDAVAAYVRFARTTLPKLEKAWAAPHRADPVTQVRECPKYFQTVLETLGLEGDGAAGMEKPVPRWKQAQPRTVAPKPPLQREASVSFEDDEILRKAARKLKGTARVSKVSQAPSVPVPQEVNASFPIKL